MKKIVRRLMLVLIFFGLLAPMAKGQTLGELVRAVQRRKILYQESISSGRLRPIIWAGLPTFPTDSQVDALSVESQFGLLKHIQIDVNILENEYVDSDTPGAVFLQDRDRDRNLNDNTFKGNLQRLAYLVSHLKTLPWLTEYVQKQYTHSQIVKYPFMGLQSPLSMGVSNKQIRRRNEQNWVSAGNFFGFSVSSTYSQDFGVVSGSGSRTECLSVGVLNYSPKAAGSTLYSGNLDIFENYKYLTTALTGSESIAGPVKVISRKLWKNSGVHYLGICPSSLEDFGGSTINGRWNQFRKEPPFPRRQYVFVPEFKNQINPELWNDVYNPFDSVNISSQISFNWLSPLLMEFDFGTYFTADFGKEFSFPEQTLPEKAPPLQLVPDLARGLLKVRLASAPASDCELVWEAPPIVPIADLEPGSPQSQFGGLSARNILGVMGCGNWDAVYSGLLSDREPQLYWKGGYLNPNGRWLDFGKYVKEWWKPVLTQLVTFSGTNAGRTAATYGLNIIQHGRFRYQIDFYRANQVGPKNTMTGRYAFLGSPVDSWIVENPTKDDGQNGLLKITATNAIYTIGLSQTIGPDVQSIWHFEMIDRQSGNVLRSGTTTITELPRWLSTPFYTPMAVVENNVVDHAALPEVTGTYNPTEDFDHIWVSPLNLMSRLEQGSDGSRTTLWPFSYYSKSFVQTDGYDPGCAFYDGNQLLTSASNGPMQEQVSYSGMLATGTETFNGVTMRTFQTTYSPDMTTVTTTLESGSFSGAVPTTNAYYSGTDAVNPWGLQLVRGIDGALKTYSYAWSGSNFVTTAEVGRGASTTGTTVIAGTQTVTTVNPEGQVISRDVYDIQSGAELDFADATEFQSGTPFPSLFSRPLGTTEAFSYDAEGQILSHTDQMGMTTNYTTDALGRLTQATRGAVTWTIAYNPGYLGESGTMRATGVTTETWSKQSSPLGGIQTETISGPENITITGTETAGSLVRQVQNSTTLQTMTDSLDKLNLAESITGNATEPWNISYSFPGSGGWTRTTTDANDASVMVSDSCDALGRVIEEVSPSPGGSGSTVATAYGYTNGQLSSAADPVGTTQYGYQADGTLHSISRGARSVSVTRNGSALSWTCTNALGETLWTSGYNAGTGVATVTPYGQSVRIVTTTPTISGDVLKMVSTDSSLTGTDSWQDGVPYQTSFTGAGMTFKRTASSNPFGEVTSVTDNPGGIFTNTLTTTFQLPGLPNGISGLISASITNGFDSSTGLTQTSVRNGHSQTQTTSPEGLWMGLSTAYSQPWQNWGGPSYSGNITRTLTTGAGAVNFTYSPAGTLLQRNFPDGTHESFAYDSNGAVSSWTNPTGTLSFAPNEYGEPTQSGTYGTIGYDNAGRVNAVTDAAGSCALSYTNGQIASESYGSGIFAGQSLTHSYNGLGQLTGVSLPGGVSVGYTYNTDGSLHTVRTAAGLTGTYSNYFSVNGRAQNFSLGPLAVTDIFDGLGRNASQVSAAGGVASAYGRRLYDADGHCTSVSAPDGAWGYAYNSFGYLETAYNSTTSQRLSYDFDATGRPAHTTDYRATAQINSGIVTVLGSVAPRALVTINGTAAMVNGTTGLFSKTYTPSADTWQTYHIVGSLTVGGTTSTAVQQRNVFVPPATETLSYDSSGDLSSDARWSDGWNSLGQLTSISETAPYQPAMATQIACVYDLEGRRVQKTVSIGGHVSKRTTTLWDDWRPVMETDYNVTNAIIAQRYYTWGPDVSGSIDGAAGIGGLVEIAEKIGNTTLVSLPIYDGIGNVVGYVDGTTGVRVATYIYDPFGELQAAYGPRAALCPIGYQTKLYDPETGYSYFGKRYFNPKTGWISRDPIREDGGVNLYAYCGDQPVGNFDPIGEDDSDGGVDGFFGYLYNGFFNWMDPTRAAEQSHLSIMTGLYGGEDAYTSQIARWEQTTLDPMGDMERQMVHANDYGLPFDSNAFVRNYQNANACLQDYAQTRGSIDAAPVDLTAFLLTIYGPGLAGKAGGLAEESLGVLLNSRLGNGAPFADSFRIPRMPEGYQGGPGARWFGENLSTNPYVGRGFKSFDALKRFLGSAGEGNVWHHIVEQSQEGKFGAFAIHNTDNVIPIPEGLNSDLNAFYSSIRPDVTGSPALTVRQWVSEMNLPEQYQFGRRVLINVSQQAW
jgi:RHS repeat-associated protein